MTQVDGIQRIMSVNRDLGARITEARGWRGELATIYGDRRHPSGFSKHFVDWCKQSGFADAEFLKAGRAGFGGFADERGYSPRPAVVLVHGNGCDATVMAPTISELLRQGFRPEDIYAVSYGKGDPERAANETHAPAYARDLRVFFDAVAGYTGRELIVVGHSKGVTDAQLAIHGVSVDGLGEEVQFAKKLPVRTFIGAAGANQGLSECRTLPFLPVSNRYNGFHPDAKLFQLLPTLGKVADKVISIVARDDELENDELKTAQLPFQDGQVILSSGGHMAPIWEPQALVALVTDRRHDLVARDAYESIRPNAKYANALSPFAITDALLVASEHFMGAGLEAANLRDPLVRAGCGVATLVEAMRAAMVEVPQLQLAWLASIGMPARSSATSTGALALRAH